MKTYEVSDGTVIDSIEAACDTFVSIRQDAVITEDYVKSKDDLYQCVHFLESLTAQTEITAGHYKVTGLHDPDKWPAITNEDGETEGGDIVNWDQVFTESP